MLPIHVAQVFAGLPERYEIVTKNPLSGNCPFVTDMAVTYSSPPDVQNAVQDATYFGDNRQFSSLDSGVFLSEEEAIANGFEQARSCALLTGCESHSDYRYQVLMLAMSTEEQEEP